ncbi:LacI family DNA-binding transcriptional regulator [Photobacterium gaetbulicola]|uniref:LacI family DNA-binding transcriptional regulator n=1 Tax=Photobacterium gaetbulicola TaxID=1295392 RepID=UPI00068BC47F|nr:LacI family DNA-binding transcriptional regulator [Photobacterium gaetbulicola]
MITIKELAKALGVSHSTVSRALNDHHSISEKTKQRIRAEAQRLGYVVNQAANTMKGNSTNSIGLLIPDIDNAFYARLTSILTDKFHKQGLNVILSVTKDDAKQEEEVLRQLLSLRPKLIIFVPSPNISEASLNLLKDTQSLQLIRRTALGNNFDFVGIDEKQSISNTVNYLVRKGHKSIAYFGRELSTSTGKERLVGFEQACNDADIDYEVYIMPKDQYAGARDMIAQLDTIPKFTAIILGGERISQGVWAHLQRDNNNFLAAVSIVNFGNFEWSRIVGCNNLYINLPLEDIAQSCFDIAVSGAKTDHPINILHPTTVISKNT